MLGSERSRTADANLAHVHSDGTADFEAVALGLKKRVDVCEAICKGASIRHIVKGN